MKTIVSLKNGLALDTKLSTANEALLHGAQNGGGEKIQNNETPIVQPIVQPKEVRSVKITESAFKSIYKTVGTRRAESGGLPFGKIEDMVIQEFIFDKNAITSRSTYTFNTDFLNPEIKKMWNNRGLACLGFIHSHPYGSGRPSSPDISYFKSMFEQMPRPFYITPIIFTEPDGGFEFNTFIIAEGMKDAVKVDLYIVLPNGKEIRKDLYTALPEWEKFKKNAL